MKISKHSVTLATIFAVCGLLLASCGGGSGGASTTGANTPVTSADSPIPNTTGVKTTLDDGTQVYLLSENTNADETKNMKILSSPDKTGGDVSKLVGKTFLEFQNLASRHEQAVITAGTAKRVFKCDLETKKCTVIGHNSVGAAQISFEVEEGKFYAIK